MNKDNYLYTDFQGWGVYALTLRDILDKIAVKEGDDYIIKGNNIYLDSVPVVYEDDGMGYGVNERYISSFDCFEHNGQKHINIFADAKSNETEEQG